jgi:hypothetical protein
VQFTGQFVIATTSPGAQYLERCGTGLHRLLAEINPVGVGAHAILFYNDPNGHRSVVFIRSAASCCRA